MSLFDLTIDDFAPLEASHALPGIYIFLDTEGNYLYIGESNNIKRRISEHTKSKKWWPTVDKILVHAMSSPSDRLIAETVLQLRHFPRHCKAIKLGLSADKKKAYSLQFIRSRDKCQKV